MHISNFNQCFYSKRGYGSLWKEVNLPFFFSPTPLPSHQFVFITSATWTVSVSNFAPGPAFISWGGSITINILERPYLTEVSDVRSELPVWSQWEEQVDVCKGLLCLTTHTCNTSEHFFADEWGGFCHFSSYQSSTEVLLSTYYGCPQPRTDNLTQWGEDLNLAIMSRVATF